MKGGINIEIQIIGSNNYNALKTIKNINKLNKLYNINLIRHNDKYHSKKYNVKKLPGIVIDGKLVCQGKFLSTRELCKLLTVS